LPFTYRLGARSICTKGLARPLTLSAWPSNSAVGEKDFRDLLDHGGLGLLVEIDQPVAAEHDVEIVEPAVGTKKVELAERHHAVQIVVVVTTRQRYRARRRRGGTRRDRLASDA
jgi:hypothetical protein